MSFDGSFACLGRPWKGFRDCGGSNESSRDVKQPAKDFFRLDAGKLSRSTSSSKTSSSGKSQDDQNPASPARANSRPSKSRHRSSSRGLAGPDSVEALIGQWRNPSLSGDFDELCHVGYAVDTSIFTSSGSSRTASDVFGSTPRPTTFRENFAEFERQWTKTR